MILNSPTISGSLTVTGNIITSGSITISGSIASASYATNAELLDGLDSTAFATTGAYSATSASLYATSASLSATSGSLSATSGSLSATSGSLSATSGSLSTASGSFNTRVTALEVTGSALSSSLLTVSGSGYATSGSLSTASGSFDSRVATIESKYATTGSNTFTSTQVVSGSILQSGSFTTTGTIIAQTINVQTVTSSVVYSSGSNVFGNSLGNSQTFTGSVLVTGSLTLTGPMIGSSTACFSGTLCANYLYSATSVVANTTLFTGADIRKLSNNQCIFFKNAAGDNEMTIGGTGNVGIGNTGNSSRKLEVSQPTGYSAGVRIIADSNADAKLQFLGTGGSSQPDIGVTCISPNDLQISTGGCERMRITSTGIACFACQVCAPSFIGGTMSGTTIYGSTAVCSPVGLFSGCVGIGCSSPTALLHVYVNAAATVTVAKFTAANYSYPSNKTYIQIGTQYSDGSSRIGSSNPSGNLSELFFETAIVSSGDFAERMRITSGGNVLIGTTCIYNTANFIVSAGSGASSSPYMGIFNCTTSPTADASTRLDLGFLGGASNYVASGGCLGAINFMGQGNDAGYGGASIITVTTCGGNTCRYNHAVDMVFTTKPTGNTGPPERMRITSGGNIGIGTCSPSEKLHLYNSTAATTLSLVIENSINNYNSQINFKSIYGGSTARSYLIGSNISIAAGSWEVYDATVAAARLVITNDGTMLVGGASSSGAYNLSLGNATANTYYQVRSTNTNSLYGSDTRGTWMGNLSGKEAYMNASTFVPGVDNSTSLGTSCYRWSVVYAVNGSIQTSDERQKTNISTSDLGLDFINKLNPVSYKWKVGGNDVEYSSVEDENIKLTPTSVATPKAGVRTHYGLIAQQVKEILGDKDFGGYVYDTETDTMSLRYDQFISPLIKAIQELKAENDIFKTCLGIS